MRCTGTASVTKAMMRMSAPQLGQASGRDSNSRASSIAENVETWTYQWKREGFQQGLEQGREQGGREETRHLLIRQVRRLFGPSIAMQTGPLLARINDLQQLEDLGDQLVISPDGEDWLGAVRAIQPASDR